MQGESYDVHADLLRSILMLITTIKTMVISVMEVILQCQTLMILKTLMGNLRGAVAKGISSLASENYRAGGRILRKFFRADCRFVN